MQINHLIYPLGLTRVLIDRQNHGKVNETELATTRGKLKELPVIANDIAIKMTKDACSA